MERIGSQKLKASAHSILITRSGERETVAGEAALSDFDTGRALTFPDAGLVSDLIAGSLLLIKRLRHAATHNTAGADVSRQNWIRLDDCYAKLNLWSDALRDGNLETALGVVPDLRQPILENLAKIAEVLVKGLKLVRRSIHY
jgi:hypothetical protein